MTTRTLELTKEQIKAHKRAQINASSCLYTATDLSATKAVKESYEAALVPVSNIAYPTPNNQTNYANIQQ